MQLVSHTYRIQSSVTSVDLGVNKNWIYISLTNRIPHASSSICVVHIYYALEIKNPFFLRLIIHCTIPRLPPLIGMQANLCTPADFSFLFYLIRIWASNVSPHGSLGSTYAPSIKHATSWTNPLSLSGPAAHGCPRCPRFPSRRLTAAVKLNCSCLSFFGQIWQDAPHLML